MHGKQFLLDSVHAGIDDANLYVRLDFLGKLPETEFEVVVLLASDEAASDPRDRLRLALQAKDRKLESWQLTEERSGEVLANQQNPGGVQAAVGRNIELGVPLSQLGMSVSDDASVPAGKLRLRISLWQNHLPVDALPVEGWIELPLLGENLMASLAV